MSAETRTTSGITLKPLASAMRDVLQKHEKEVDARRDLANAQMSSQLVRDVTVPAAEKRLVTAGLALDATLLEFNDQLNDAIVAAVRDVVGGPR